MKIEENVSLADYTTMQLGGPARYFITATSEEELQHALHFAKQKEVAFHILGGGSNSIFQDAGFPGVVIAIRIIGIEAVEKDNELHLSAGAGEVWDDVVSASVKAGYFDIAALSLIPGTVGAAPVQNIGAYGQQISDVIHTVRAYDIEQGDFVELLQQDCNFTYRHSRFNTTDAKRFIITNVKMRLYRKTITPPFYADVATYLSTHNIDSNALTPAELRKAVSTIRTIKLPDPSTVANAGSFFKNPIISDEEFTALEEDHPDIHENTAGQPQLPYWRQPDGSVKIAAGWLIEACGLKGYHDQETGMATWKNQALVLVNESAKTTEDLLAFRKKIITAVQEKFNITLEQEPELVAV